MELILDICREKGIPNFSASLVLQWYRMAQARGYGKKDSSSIFRLMRELPKQDN
jgi:3-hydroxyisobutyrate dehydrogenase-like beta-hydroxyacid dehydrogenase